MKKVLTTLCLLAFALVLKAAYLENVPVTLTQPDGAKLKCFASGDEFYNYLHDENGFTIIQDHSNGFYVYADLKDGELVPTDLIPGRSNPAIRLKPYLNISPEKRMAKRKAWEVPEHLRKPETRNRDTNHGTLNNIVIFIRFADDAEFQNTFSSVNNMFNENVEKVSMQSYFKEASYNQINIPTTFYPAPNGERIISYKDTYNRNYFQPYNAVTNPDGYVEDEYDTERTVREQALLKRAVDYINAHNMIPSDLNVDYDNDGYVDNVCFVVRGTPGAWSSLLWPHQWSLYNEFVYINGKRVWTFNFQLADAGQGYFDTSTMCHEMNHSLGAPDLYHYSYTGPTPVGYWDLMQNNATPPQHMGAYMKYRYGNWIDEIPEITEAGVYTLHDLSSSTNNCYKIASPVDGQYYVLEYRKKSVEAAVPGTGLLIYRINTAEDGYGNRYWDGISRFDEVYIFRPNGTTTVEGSINNAYFSAGSGRTAFDASTNPKPFLIDGTVDENLMISDISAAGETISFRVGSSCDAPTNLTASLVSNEVILTWDAAEDIATYSVYRNNALIDNSVTTTSFTDHLSAYGNYSYYVKSNCPGGGNSMASNQAEVSYVYPGPVVTNLSGDVDGNIVTLEWTEPESRTATLEYFTMDDEVVGSLGFGVTNATFYWGMRYPTSMLSDYNGMSINSITMPFRYAGTYNIKIYQGDNTTNANLVFGGGVEIGSSLLNSFITINLSPVTLDCSKDLWVTVSVYGKEYPAYYGSFPAGGNYACLYSSDGISWVNYALNYSWTIFTTITDGTFTYNISKDGVVIAQNQTGSSYTYTENDNGFHEYHLTTNYCGDESQSSNSVYVPAGANKQFLGTDNADWSTASNWKDGSAPTSSDLIWVRHNVDVNNDVEINSLYISENNMVTVNSNATLAVADDAESRAGTEGLVIESGAALVTDASNLPGTAKRMMTDAAKDEWLGLWHFLASPVDAAPIFDFTNLAGNHNYDLYLYDEPSVKWFNEKLDNHSADNDFYTTNGVTFNPGRGYLASFESNAIMPFEGNFNTGEVSIPVTANSNSSLKGFNLLGNPYPCAIDWNAADGWSREVLGDNPYFYVYDDAIGQYRVYSESTGGVPEGTTNIIAPCQGFFVIADQGGSVAINNNAKVSAIGSFRKGADNNAIRVRVSGKNGSDEVMICERDEMQPSAEKLFSMDERVPSLSVVDNESEYAIFVVDEEKSQQPVYMSFLAGKTGRFTISSDAEVELLDLRTGIATDLSETDYEFESSLSDYAVRFVLRHKGNDFVGKDDFVYQYGNEWVFRSSGRVQVIDITGHVLIDNNLTGTRLDVSSLKTGVYIVRFFGDEVLTQKMMKK